MSDRHHQKQVQISFDDMNRIRILDADHFAATTSLAEESTGFTQKIDQFTGVVDALVDVLTTQSKNIEQEKLMAIGQRNRIDSEQQTRERKARELRSLIQQHKAELQREKDHYASLVKVRQEQQALIEKLQQNEK